MAQRGKNEQNMNEENEHQNTEATGIIEDNQTYRTTLEIEAHLYPIITVLIFGHSFIRRLAEYAIRTFGIYHNLGLDYNIANVHFHGIGGLTAERARYEDLHTIARYRPDLIYIELGSNDLCNVNNRPETVGNTIYEFINDLLGLNTNLQGIVVGETIFREGRGIPRRIPNYNNNVILLNQYNRVVLNSENIPRTSVWRHRGLWNSRLATLNRDGVHLNELGMYRHYRSIRGAIIHAIRRIRRSQ